MNGPGVVQSARRDYSVTRGTPARRGTAWRLAVGLWRLGVAVLAICGAVSGCRPAPNAVEGRRRLAGRYSYADLRNAYINPHFKSASLELRADGTASQTCEFKDGTRYHSSRMTWSYHGAGNVHIDPLKDCSWVYPGSGGALEVPKTGASLIVEWYDRPIILMDPDINAFYEHQ